MNCTRIHDKLHGYLEGDLRMTEQLCVEVHLSRCYYCKEELEDLREANALISTALRHPSPQDGYEELYTRIRELELPTAKKAVRMGSWSRFRKSWALATCALILVVAVPVYTRSSAEDESSAVSLTPSTQAGSVLVIHPPLDRYKALVEDFEFEGLIPAGPDTTSASARVTLDGAV